MHDIFRDGFFTASTHSALTSTITHKSSVYPAFWLPPISTCVTVSPVYLLENRTRLLRISSTLVGYNSRAPSSQPTVIYFDTRAAYKQNVPSLKRDAKLDCAPPAETIEITQTVFTEIHYFARTVVISQNRGSPLGIVTQNCGPSAREVSRESGGP